MATNVVDVTDYELCLLLDACNELVRESHGALRTKRARYMEEALNKYRQSQDISSFKREVSALAVEKLAGAWRKEHGQSDPGGQAVDIQFAGPVTLP